MSRDNTGIDELAANRDSAFVRGLKVLTAVTDNGEVRASAIADQVDLPLSTVYRYLRTLRDLSLVEERDGTYTAGWRLAEASGHDPARVRLVEIGHPFLQEVTRRTGETSVLTVRIGTAAMCLRQVEAPRPEPAAFRINQLLPLHAGIGQRVLLAHAPVNVIQHVVGGPLRKITRNTLHGADLAAELRRIRSIGWAVSRGELAEGTVAIGVPVFAAGGEMVCSLAVAGHESRCDDAWVARARAVLLDSASRLSSQLGAPSARRPRAG